MQCNIDARGQAVRLIIGIVEVVVALTLLGLATAGLIAAAWPWILAALLLIVGGFQIFEGWAGWCVVRAMGFKTKV